MKEIVFTAAVRTPMAKNGGIMTDAQAMDLGALVIKEAVNRSKIDPKEYGECIFSCITAMQVKNPARACMLAAGMPVEVPGFTVDRGCGSSLTGMGVAAAMIEAGYFDAAIVGGVESCSNRPFLMNRVKNPAVYAPPGWSPQILTPPEYENLSNGETAEVVADRYGITREECDAFAAESHRKTAEAWKRGAFDEQIVPVTIKQRKKDDLVITKDQIYREDCTASSLAKLPGSFRKGGVSTAGNSSPLTDGAACVVMMTKEKADAAGCDILGCFKHFVSVGLEPQIMGMGPYYAVKKMLNDTGLSMSEIDLIEINEAFASQSVACIKLLKEECGLDETKVNVNGGAIAIGHPFGASGAILTARMLYALKERDLKRGIITFCVGAGLGVAMLVER